MIEALIVDGEAAVETQHERRAICTFFAGGDAAAPMPTRAEWKEFVVRSVCPRPCHDAPHRTTVSRTYALIGQDDLRMASVTSLDENW